MRTTVCNLCEEELELENGRAQKYEPEMPGGNITIGADYGATKHFQIHVEERGAAETDLCDECFRAVIAAHAHALARQAAGEDPECLKNPDLIGFNRLLDFASLNPKEQRFAEMYGGVVGSFRPIIASFDPDQPDAVRFERIRKPLCNKVAPDGSGRCGRPKGHA